MTRLTRRAVLAAAGITVIAGLALRKLLVPDRERAAAVPSGSPDVDMRPLDAIVPVRPPSVLPAVTFRSLEGALAPLSAYAGRPTVLNFWATWCVPCVAELPELDRLARTEGLTVLAVAADRGGAAIVRPFIAAHGITHVTVLLDQGSDAVHALQVAGFPTTLLIGADGRLRGTLEGPAAWGGAAPRLKQMLSN